jgi:predicted DNA-binding transcriptional regulator YafY
MSKQTAITRYLLILKKLQRGPATFGEVRFSLETAGEIRGARYATDLRTFQRDLHEIEALFGVRIAWNRAARAYSIAERAPDCQHALRTLDAYEMLDALHATDGYSEHVFFEARRPSGLEAFSPLLGAIKAGHVVRIGYQKFGHNTAQSRTVHPLALKEARSRWYLVAEDPADGIVKTFGLDRILDVDVMTQAFVRSKDLDLSALFQNFFGVLTPPDAPLERVLLKFTAFQGQYVKTYPLHHSQRVLEETIDRMLIELTLCITLDFVMELLSFGTSLTVLSPLSLVDEMVRHQKESFLNHQALAALKAKPRAASIARRPPELRRPLR